MFARVCVCVRACVVQGGKLPALAMALAKGAKDVVTSGIVYWGPADPKGLEVRVCVRVCAFACLCVCVCVCVCAFACLCV